MAPIALPGPLMLSVKINIQKSRTDRQFGELQDLYYTYNTDGRVIWHGFVKC